MLDTLSTDAACMPLSSRSEYVLVDPSLEEEQVMEGRLVVGMNTHMEICVLQMIGGVAILPEQVSLPRLCS